MNTSLVAKVLSIAGLTGSTPTANAFIPTSKHSPYARDEFEEAGAISNPDIWSTYNSATARPRTLEEQLRSWDEMAHWDLMAAALSEITDEATQVDPASPGLLWYETNKKEITDELNAMIASIGAEELVPSQIWHVAGYGNGFEKIDYTPGEGVQGFSAVHPLEMRRYWLKRNRRCVGFRWQGNIPHKDEVFKIGDMPIMRAALNHGNANASNVEQLWYPWDFLHFRRMRRARQTEHGEPLFEEAQGIYKKLRMAIDHMVVHRAQVQPDRYIVNIDVKDLPPIEQVRAVNRWKQSMRTKLSFGSGGSKITDMPDDFKAFYNAMALDTVLWMAKPRDFNHSIEKIAGTASVPDVHDIEMLTNLFFAIVGLPKSWIGLGDPGKDGGPVSGKALLAQDMRFLRKVKSLRAAITNAYTWLGYFHCVLRGHDISSITIKAHMPPITGLEDQMQLELLAKQAELLDTFADIMPKFGIPREAWVDVIFRKYMHLPDDIIDAFITALPPEQELAGESVKPSVHPSKVVLLQRIKQQLESTGKQRQLQDLECVLNGKIPQRGATYKTPEDVLRPATLQENDIIVAGFGQFDPLNDFKPRSYDARAPHHAAPPISEALSQYRRCLDAHISRLH